MQEVKTEKCPYCGGTELLDCRCESYGGLYVSYKARKCYHKAGLFALVCRDCGSVVRMYTKTPEKLFPSKDRRK